MAKIFIPSQMRDMTGGRSEIDLPGGSLRQVIQELDRQFPGIGARLLDGERLVPGLAVSIDGEISSWALRAKIGPDSEVHFVAAISGGA